MLASNRNASPERWASRQGQTTGKEHSEELETPTAGMQKEESNRHLTAASASSADTSELARRPPASTHVSRMTTRRDDATDLEHHPTALSRIQTGRNQHNGTIGASLLSRTVTRHSKTPMPPFGGGKAFPPPLPAREEYVVEFDGPKDPMHAQNWPFSKKWPITATLAFVNMTSVFGSSIWSAAITSVSKEYHFSTEVGTLGTSLYVLGYAFGPFL